MSSYYDAFGGSSGPPDPFEDWEPAVPTSELVSTFVRPQFRDNEPPQDEPEYDGSELDDHTMSTSVPRKWLRDEAADINIVTGEVEE